MDRDGRVEADGVVRDLTGLAGEHAGRPVIALAAGADVLLASARVPTQSRQKLLRAIPYALEEQLASDVEDAHFVLGDRHDGAWAVAVVQTNWLEGWLARLTEAGLRPERLFAEPLCLPLHEQTWSVLVDRERFLVRTGPQHGFGGDTDNLDVLLEAALEEQGEARPAMLRVWIDGAEPDLPEEISGVPVVTERARSVELVAAGVAAGAPMQLLTPPYAPVRQGAGLFRPWLPVAVLLAAWVIVDTGLALFEQRSMRAEIDQVESRAMSAYQDLFPGATNLDQARTRVGNRLRQASGGDVDHEDMLDTVRLIGPVLANGDGFRLQGMSYRNGVLELELETESLQHLDQLQQELDRGEHVGAEVRSARSEDDAVQGRLVVRRQGS